MKRREGWRGGKDRQEIGGEIGKEDERRVIRQGVFDVVVETIETMFGDGYLRD